MFVQTNVVKTWPQEEKFNKIPKNKLAEVIHNIYPEEKDQQILAVWEKHFQDQGIPYAITQVTIEGKTPTKSIWKEDLIER